VNVAIPVGGTVYVQLNGAGTWYTCTFAGTAVTCDLSAGSDTVLAAASLRVIIAQ
jgi:hypothetical protein